MADQFKACSVSDCNGNAHSRHKGGKGMCRKHYHRFKRHGDPLGGGTYNGELQKFYDEVVLTYEGDDCLIWPYSKAGKGYAQMYVGGAHVYVSRRLCEEVNGSAPTPDHDAAHSCGQGLRGCVTRHHMRWATRAENLADKLIHGTHDRGEKSTSAKLTDAQAREIIALKGKEKQALIASRFGVSFQLVSRIQSGKAWKWLQEQ